MSKEPIDYLKHISDECAYIISVSTELTKDELYYFEKHFNAIKL